MSQFKFAAVNEAVIYEKVVDGKGVNPVNKILLGTYVLVLEEDGDWYKVSTAGPDGWMNSGDLSSKMGLKIFFLDVGQGDGILLEVGNYRILIDAGPGSHMYNYLTKWQYTYLLKTEKKIHIDFLIVSHFDIDHYKGFIAILNDNRFTFGTIVHPGILKFGTKTRTYNSGLGKTIKSNGETYLDQVFDDLLKLNQQLPLSRDTRLFVEALQLADKEGRVQQVKRLESGNAIVVQRVEGKIFRIDVLAPFLETISDRRMFVYWKDDGITVNGHSLVLKIKFGRNTVLLGGDLNTVAQDYIMGKYGRKQPFTADVAKSCHHGSSDFSTLFLHAVKPYATVISSGDNESHSHPRADAIGCAGKYSRGKRPLVYATELARSTNLRNNKILFGMINLRCNGKEIYMSQMKEVKNNADIWDAYKVK